MPGGRRGPNPLSREKSALLRKCIEVICTKLQDICGVVLPCVLFLFGAHVLCVFSQSICQPGMCLFVYLACVTVQVCMYSCVCLFLSLSLFFCRCSLSLSFAASLSLSLCVCVCMYSLESSESLTWIYPPVSTTLRYPLAKASIPPVHSVCGELHSGRKGVDVPPRSSGFGGDHSECLFFWCLLSQCLEDRVRNLCGGGELLLVFSGLGIG